MLCSPKFEYFWLKVLELDNFYLCFDLLDSCTSPLKPLLVSLLYYELIYR